MYALFRYDTFKSFFIRRPTILSGRVSMSFAVYVEASALRSLSLITGFRHIFIQVNYFTFPLSSFLFILIHRFDTIYY